MTITVTPATPADGTFSATGSAAWAAGMNLAQATGKLLGRSTALDGATEEISVGSGLSLAAGTLSATGGSGPSLETDGAPNGDQTLLNLKSGTNVTLTDDGLGGVTIDASGSVGNIQLLQWFGDGSDGNVTVSGPVTMTRDMYYDTLTCAAGCAINTGSFRIFCKTNLDLSNAPAGAITRDGLSGVAATNASGVTGGSNGTATLTTGSLGAGSIGSTGANGGTTNGASPGALTVVTPMGGKPGAGGAGGNGTSGNGASGGSLAFTIWMHRRASVDLLRGAALLLGGTGGLGGGSGGGDGTAGGGSGAGVGGPGVVGIWANTITRGASTAANCITSNGGTSGNGGTPVAGNRGGGGGSGGPGGGWIYIVYATLAGSVATNALQANGGTGGNGGNATGTGTAGTGGTGGFAGRMTLIDVSNNTVTETDGTATAGTGPSGTTGGTGGACQANL